MSWTCTVVLNYVTRELTEQFSDGAGQKDSALANKEDGKARQAANIVVGPALAGKQITCT